MSARTNAQDRTGPMIRIGSVEDVVLESAVATEWSSEAAPAWSWPRVPRQRGSVGSGSTTS